MVIPKSVAQIKSENPFPWREVVRQANGFCQVAMLDANNAEVSIFSMTTLLEHVTSHQQKETPPQDTASNG